MRGQQESRSAIAESGTAESRLNIRARRLIYKLHPEERRVSYKTIIVHLDAGKRRRPRLDLACTLAQRYDARLVGLFALEREPAPVAPEAAPMLIEDMLKQRRVAAEEAAQEFADTMRAQNYGGKSEWCEAPGDGFAGLRHYARHADLVVAGQPDPEGGGVPASFSHDLVMSVGRPVLYVPFAGRFADCGTRVLVPWNASREAARALADALSFLRGAKAVEVITFDREKLFRPIAALPEPDMRAHLARHGVNASVVAQPGGGIDIGSAILSRAADTGADLIVMGAYSHSRARELVLGGATRTLFRSMTVPTLMSH
jgi:nucleotide-binding universal stress UspA family protein